MKSGLLKLGLVEFGLGKFSLLGNIADLVCFAADFALRGRLWFNFVGVLRGLRKDEALRGVE